MPADATAPRRWPLTTSSQPHSSAAPGTFAGLGGCWRRAQCLGMMSFTDLASVPSDRLVRFTDPLRLAVAAYLARFKGSSRAHTSRTCAVSSPSAQSAGWTRWPRGARTWSCTSGGCRRSATSSPRRCRGGSWCRPGSTGPASSTAFWSTHRPARAPPGGARGVADPGLHPFAVRGAAHRGPPVTGPVRFCAGGHAGAAGLANLRGHRCGHRRSG